MTYAFLFVFAVLIVVFLSAGWWFNELGFVKRVRDDARRVDEMQLQVLGNKNERLSWTLFKKGNPVQKEVIDLRIRTSELRTQKGIGDAVTTAHFLADFASVIERKMSRSIAGGLLFSSAFAVWPLVTEANKLATSPAGKQLTTSQIWERVMDSGLSTIGLPATTLLVSIFLSGASLYLYEEMVSRCRIDFQSLIPSPEDEAL